jgi:hypothetical protein
VPNVEVRVIEQLYMPLVQSRMMIGVEGFGIWKMGRRKWGRCMSSFIEEQWGTHDMREWCWCERIGEGKQKEESIRENKK